jgi:hypothetical protein
MSKFKDVFNKYKTYDDSNGRGNLDEWRSSFESMHKDEAIGLLKKKDPLSIFGLTELPNLESLKKIYRKLMMENHPDHGGDHKKCKEIIAAFTLLEIRCK